MTPKQRQIARQQLDKTLSQFGSAKGIQAPVKGWIRAVREVLGMSGTQLAQRLKVSQPRIPKLEQDELSGAVTLKTSGYHTPCCLSRSHLARMNSVPRLTLPSMSWLARPREICGT